MLNFENDQYFKVQAFDFAFFLCNNVTGFCNRFTSVDKILQIR